MEGLFGVLGLLGVLISVGIPVVMIVLFVILVTSTKRQEALLKEILVELRQKEANRDYLNQ